MSKYVIDNETLSSIGNAIRSKTGKSDLIAPGNMPEEIESIENQLFCLAMKDYWDRSDYEDEKYLIEKKNKLEAQLKELEK